MVTAWHSLEGMRARNATMLRLRREGLSLAAIGRELGCTKVNVHLILKRCAPELLAMRAVAKIKRAAE